MSASKTQPENTQRQPTLITFILQIQKSDVQVIVTFCSRIQPYSQYACAKTCYPHMVMTDLLLCFLTMSIGMTTSIAV